MRVFILLKKSSSFWAASLSYIILLISSLVFCYWAFDESFHWEAEVGSSNSVLTVNSASVSGSNNSGNALTFGMSAPFNGSSRGLGIELYRGSKAYFEHVNKMGGIHGRSIDLIAYDDGYEPQQAIQNTLQLIERDNVFLLFNYVGTPTATRCLPVLKKERDRSIYLFFPFTGSEPQRQPPYQDFVFNLRSSYYEETAGLVDHFVSIKRDRIAIFYQIDAYGRNGWEGVRAALSRHNLKMVGEATYHRGETAASDMSRQVEILRRSEANVVIVIGSYGASAAFIRSARDCGWDVPIANISFVDSVHLLDILQQAGKSSGVDYTQDLINSQVVPSFDDLSLAAVREFRELMDRYRPQPPTNLVPDGYPTLPLSFVSFEGFLNAKLLVALLSKMGEPFERTRLKDVTESTHDLDLGLDVRISFSRDRHQAMNKVYYSTVHQGRVVPLTDWSRWSQ